MGRQSKTAKRTQAAAPPSAARQAPLKRRAAAAEPVASTALARRAPEQVLQTRTRSRLDDDLAKAFELAKQSQADSTQGAYRSDREHWKAYAHECNLPPYPISTEHLAAYVISMDGDGYAVSTIRRRCAALSRWHRDQDDPSPTANEAFRRVIQGLLRKRNAAPTKKRALTGTIVGKALLDPSFSLRDRTVLAVGFATGLRRSELVQLRWDDLVEHPDGYAVRIGRSKTDKTGKGQFVAVRRHEDPELCPVTLLHEWHSAQGGHEVIFPIYDKMVAEIVKRAVTLSGEDPAVYSGHSLRAGMITAAGQDASVPQSMTQKAARHVRGDQTLDYMNVHNTLANPAFGASVNAIQRGSAKPATATPVRRKTASARGRRA